jgi:hypothetical protein
LIQLQISSPFFNPPYRPSKKLRISSHDSPEMATLSD